MAKLAPIRHPGNESLFTAVEMSLVSTFAGVPLHIHAEGLRGTGKTTVMRWAKSMVPSISQYRGCPYHCRPDRPHCPVHEGKDLPGPDLIEDIPMPFVEIGHGAKLGTILGSIDLERLTDRSRPEAAILPGAIPMANRGIIFIDEVNRLAETAPEITDVLLSVMGTKPGRVKIEEVGLSACEVEVTASVWAASNPDEDPGPLEDIRRQLSDRFDLVIPVQRPQDPTVVESLLFRRGEAAAEAALALRDINAKAQKFENVTVPQPIIRYMAQLYVHRNVESLRAIEALELCSRLYAAIKGRDEATFDEVLAVIPLVLRHRVEPLTLSEILKDLELRRAAGSQVKSPAEPPSSPRPEDPATRGPAPKAGQNMTDLASSATRNLSGHKGQAGQDCRGGEVLEAATDDRRAESAGLPSPGASPGEKYGWLRQTLSRYRRSLGRLSGRTSENTGRNPAARQFIPVADPKDVPPVSPLERARRLTSLSWEELVSPPEWKDRLQ